MAYNLYRELFGLGDPVDASVTDFSEHGRAGGVSTGQPFKFVDGIDENVEYAEKSTNANILYVGLALPGTLTSEAKWKIYEIDISSGVSMTMADGNANYDNEWDDRETLSYS